MERLNPHISRILHMGFQKQFMDAADVQHPPSVGTQASAYLPEEVRRCHRPSTSPRASSTRKTEQSTTYLQSMVDGAARVAARRCKVPPFLHLLRLPEGPTTRRTKTRRFSAAGGQGSERANPIPGKAMPPFFGTKYFFIHSLNI
jgi:hypothetical protein